MISRYFTLPHPDKIKTRRNKAGGLASADQASLGAGYFCHVRFLWRFALRRLRRLCFAILRRRFFFRLPMVRVIKERNVRAQRHRVQPEFQPAVSTVTLRRIRVNTTAALTAVAGNPASRAAACR